MGGQDFGIIISPPGIGVSNLTASQSVLNTSYAQLKIDTQNAQGFQTILLLITTDPPEPVGPATDKYTVLYQFKHNYKYVPSLETLFYVSSPPPGATFTQTYFQDFGQIGAHTIADAVFLKSVVDATYVYIVVDKQNFGGGSANLLTGTNVQITTHVFVDDIGV